MPTMHLVLHDPKGEFWEGALVEEAAAITLKLRGIVTIPVDPALFLRNGVAGFMRRAWGAGWKLPPVVAGRTCPMILHMTPGPVGIHWRARLLKEPGEDAPVGTIRLTNDPAQPSAPLGGLVGSLSTVVDLTKLGPPDEQGGWFVGGSGKVSTQVDGYMGLALWGAGTGVRVVWAAVSQA